MNQVEASGLGGRVARSGGALALRAGVVMVTGFLRIALVARALGPDEMGTFAMLSAIVEGGRALTTLGPASVIVQRAEVTQSFVATFWAFRIGQGVLMAAITLGAYPVVAHIAAGSSVWGLHVLLAASLLLSSFSNPATVLETRHSQFTRVAILEACVAVIDCGATVTLAYWLKSAVALGWGAVVRSFAEVGLSFLLFPAKFSIGMDRTAAKEFLTAGWYLMLHAIGAYITLYGDNALVGAILGTHALGLYAVAYRLAELPFSTLFSITHRVMFPLMSRLQGDQARLREVVKSTILAQMLFIWPCVVVLTAFPHFILHTIYGERFAEAVNVLRALGLLTLGRAVAILVGTVLLSAGRYDQVSRLKWLEVGVFLPTLALGLYFGGLVGAALASGGAYMVAAISRTIAVRKHMGLRLGEVVYSLLFPALPAAGAYVPVLLLGLVLHQPMVELAVFCVGYLVLVALTQRALTTRAIGIVRQALRPAATLSRG
jgi:teichuronic acid exporter